MLLVQKMLSKYFVNTDIRHQCHELNAWLLLCCGCFYQILLLKYEIGVGLGYSTALPNMLKT